MTEDKIISTIILPANIHRVLADVKEASGVAISNQIYAYIYKGLIKDGLVTLKYLDQTK